MMPHRSRPTLRMGIALAAVLVIGGVGTTLAAGTTPPWKAPPFSAIGVQTIELDASYRQPDDPAVLAAFIETGSLNSRCLATLSEYGAEAFPHAVFCAPRNPTFDGINAVQGVFLHVFFDGDPGENMVLVVNVYQEGAKFYGPPVLCTFEHGC